MTTFIRIFLVISFVALSAASLCAQATDLTKFRIRYKATDPYEAMGPGGVSIGGNVKPYTGSVSTTPAPLKVKYTLADGIDNLLYQHKLQFITKKEIPGWRVQVYSTTNSDQADNIMLKVGEKLLGEHEVHKVYDQPYFKIHAGDFTNRIEAFALYSKLKKDFPGCFIVAEKVKVKIYY